MNRLPFAYHQAGLTLANDAPDTFDTNRAPDDAAENADAYPGEEQMQDDPAYTRMCWVAQALHHGALALAALLPALWLACRLLARFPALVGPLAYVAVWAAISAMAAAAWSIFRALCR